MPTAVKRCYAIINPLILLTASAFSGSSYAENNLTAQILSFEESDLPSEITGEQLTLSQDHAILGSQSLAWQWQPGGSLSINHDFNRITDSEAKSAYGSAATQVLSFWLYNTNPIDKSLTVHLSDNGSQSSSFDVKLNFSGWRAIGVSLNLDFTPSVTSELSKITFTAPADPALSGELYLDRLMVSVDDNRYQWSDDQIKTRIIKPEIDFALQDPLPTPSQQTINDAEQIRQNLINAFAGNPGSLSALENKFAAFNISKDSKGNIRGRHILTDKQQVIYQPKALSPADKVDFDEYAILGDNDDKGDKVSGYAKLMLDIAKAYQHPNFTGNRARLAEMYLLMSEHLLDQGFADGSALVTSHHWGYSGRWWYISALMMEDELANENLLAPTYKALLWFSREFKASFDMRISEGSSNMDYFNTLSRQHLALLLLNPDDSERIALLKKYSTFFSQALAQTPPGTNDGFRPDGTAFRHNGHYPGYAFPAMQNAGHVVHLLNDTEFSISKAGMDKLKLAMIAGWKYTNPVVPLAAAGRHPFANLGVKTYASAMQWLAKSYPTLDEELAAIYLQVTGTSEQGSYAVFGKRIKPAPLPQGSWSFNGGAFAVHRSGDRMAVMKGYNKDVWSSEIYTKDNRYGRYQSHGSVHVITHGDPVSQGYQQDGWDWNRNPGATTIHLPFDQLESPKTSSLMVRSEEGISGAVSLNEKVSLFTFKHRAPSNLTNFEDSFVAHKQVLATGDQLYLVGNGISNLDGINRTETTLFQLAITSTSQGIWVNDQHITNSHYTTTLKSGDWIIDDNGVGYYLIDTPVVKVQRATQNSKHSETKKNTSGLFSSAWIDHGLAPDNTGYEYIMVMQATPQKMRELAASAEGEFKVLASGPEHQVIWNKSDDLYGYTSYAATDFSDGPVKSVNTTALILVKDQTKELAKTATKRLDISVAQPELHLRSDNQPETVVVEVEGQWQTDSISDFHASENTTRLTVNSEFGQSVNILLWPVGEEKPVEPVEPVDPVDPVDPVEPDQPSNNKNGGSFGFVSLALLGLMSKLRKAK